MLVHQRGAAPEEFVNRKGTYTNWREIEIKTYTNSITGQLLARTAHPKTYTQISEADVAAARDEGCWFFRKVAEGCDCSAVWSHHEMGLKPMVTN